ncbi:GNAT family N-acetyltransferase [Hufsiella ginkgonis]|uniref:GNAT family N-acetyltransferase n=1 Tax=Hufsiella ginkgonis TaxID=2695274 RepID=A0A7K1XWZ4_9SPHI|nr:GNAT family N-acetyltransferase [Hufsiella ginkgonis]MXV15511.1 GNAT family N-acetyltransferase [Hufsiella ginkgonis]
MEIKHQENSQKGSFYVETDGTLLAEMTYSFAGIDKIVIDHTFVSDILRGQGVGNLLVDAAVSYARDNSFKIFPICPFARSVFGKVAAYNDVYIR